MAPPQKPGVLPPGMVHARQSAILMLVGLVASGTPLPWTAVAVFPLVWAAVESVRGIRATQSLPASPARTRSIGFGVVGLILVCVLTAAVLLPYTIYGSAKRLQDCNAAANTAVATAECRSNFRGGLESILGGLLIAG